MDCRTLLLLIAGLIVAVLAAWWIADKTING